MAVISIGTIIVVILLTWYTKHILDMLIPRNRHVVQQVNIKLEEMRTVSVKTLEQQKEFINLKYPKMIKRKFSWKGLFKSLPKILLMIIIFIAIFRTYYYIFQYYNIQLAVWQGILFMILFPLVLNLILEKFNIQKGDLSVFFRGGKNK